jgi:hypothetical protein
MDQGLFDLLIYINHLNAANGYLISLEYLAICKAILFLWTPNKYLLVVP